MERARSSRWAAGALFIMTALLGIASMPGVCIGQSSCDDDPFDCFNPNCSTSGNNYLRWFDSFDYHVTPNLLDLVAGPNVEDGGLSGIQSAMSTWDETIDSTIFAPIEYIAPYRETDYYGLSHVFDDTNSVGFSMIWPSSQIDDCAVACISKEGYVILECDTFFNQPMFDWDYLPAPPL